jgi:hypothetical protein
MTPLKIFSVSKNDWAGCSFFLSEAINSCTEHHSRMFRREKSRLDFPSDLSSLTGQRLRLLWGWADVIHVHDAPGVSNVDNMEPKPTVITYHGTRYRKSNRAYNTYVRDKGWVGTVATPDLTRFGLPLLPDCRPDLMEYFDPGDKFTVAHAPTKRKVKGTKRVMAACKAMGVKLDLIENVPWEECVKRKGRAHLVVDQFELGYGCNAIEAWAMGLPVISDGTSNVLSAIKEQFGYLPFVPPSPSLETMLEMMRDDVGFYNNWAEVGRNHYLKHHSPEATSRAAVGFYEQALSMELKIEKPKQPTMPKRVFGDLILMRYLGDSAGVQSWFAGESALKYQCSAQDPLFFVHEIDREWFMGQKTKRGVRLFEVEGTDGGS